MLRKCIAPGCTTGYKSNSEKVPCFSVPSDEKIAKLWQVALKRSILDQKSTLDKKKEQVVCANHFLPEEILWKKDLFYNGKIIGTVSNIYINFENKECDIHAKHIRANSTKDDANYVNENVMLTFDEVLAAMSNKTFHVPANWEYRIVSCDNAKAIVFYMYKYLSLKNFSKWFTLESVKKVFLLNDMKLTVNVMRRPVVESNLLDIRCERITSLKDLNEILFQIDNLNVCKGAINVSDNDLVTSDYALTYKDSIGTWRHNKCSLLVADSEICPLCSNVKRSIQQKRRRLNGFNIHSDVKRIRLAVSLPQIIQYFIGMRMRQHAIQINSEKEKLNQMKKKHAKFNTS
ncbi:hypothetical protein ALC60_12155 [Trachymyrmex zeteki]|uniref:THAP-type domain-containing protein n=1 Tax=Mycetomoellerius zeteki TaxID=64791 RepID=A0A151WLX2_9HYME|nr:hypothetical protein ALC60_12155 [Trachymyrmex zeteki]